MNRLKEEVFDDVLREIEASSLFRACIEIPIAYESNFTLRNLFNNDQMQLMYFAVGIHPGCIDGDTESYNWEKLEELLHDPEYRSIAVGETGLDRTYPDHYEEQKDAFRRQIEMAIRYQKPLVLHIRDRRGEESTGDAYSEAFEILREYREDVRRCKGVLHCYSGPYDVAQRYIDEYGFVIGIGGMFTRLGGHLDQTVQKIPLENIVLETDTPFLMPIGVETAYNVNTPLNIPYIAEKIADLKGIQRKTVEDATYRNALDLLGIQE